MPSFDGSDGQSLVVALNDPSAAGEARRECSALATRLGFSEERAGRVALVATELATNAIRHAGGGELLCRVINATSLPGVEILVLDRGPGIANLSHSMQDGTSSRGSPGLGLGVLRRTADEWDLYTRPDQGTAVLARLWPRPPTQVPSRFVFGGVCVPLAGETACGDAWLAAEVGGRLQVAVADGLGHGRLAAEASRPAVETFRRHGSTPLDGSGLSLILDEAHRALRAHRGAAMTVASVDANQRVAHVAGVGNVTGFILGEEGKSRGVVAHNGTLGATVRKVQPFLYPWPPGGTLVLHSDGLSSQARPDRYPGLQMHDPALIAGVLYRDFKRGTDDVTVFVAREKV